MCAYLFALVPIPHFILHIILWLVRGSRVNLIFCNYSAMLQAESAIKREEEKKKQRNMKMKATKIKGTVCGTCCSCCYCFGAVVVGFHLTANCSNKRVD